MKVIVGTHEFEVARAEQHLDGVHLYNEDGSLFVIIESPEAIDRVEDGEIVIMEMPKILAPRNITEGEYITVDGVLYKAITNIPNGEPIIVGQNAYETTIEEQLYELKGE